MEPESHEELERELADPSEDRDLPRGRGQRIICVDDEESIVYVLTRSLERLGYRAVGFTNPYEALQAFRTSPHEYDAVVSDMGMHGMSGGELAIWLHELRPELPVIIASGYGRPLQNIDGYTDWVQKPPSLEDLARVLAKHLSGKSIDTT